MTARPVMDERLLDEALAWHQALEGDDPDWAAFTLWLEADPQHRPLFDEIALTDRIVTDHRERLRALAPPSTSEIRPRRSGRRGFLYGSIAAALALAVGAVTLWPGAVA
jgi:transmembrane sensor